MPPFPHTDNLLTTPSGLDLHSKRKVLGMAANRKALYGNAPSRRNLCGSYLDLDNPLYREAVGVLQPLGQELLLERGV